MCLICPLGFPGSSVGKESACNAGKTPVQFLGWPYHLEKGQAAHSSIRDLPRWLSW